ncbi:MAG: T9SS type A sorting domain-containing protein [Ferruginibacter sp.]
MKKLLLLGLIAGLISGNVNAQVFRAFSPRYYNPSVRGNIVYVANSMVATNGIGLGVPGMGELPPSGTSKNTDGTTAYLIDVEPEGTPATIFGMGSDWKYFSNGTRPTNWPANTVNDATWLTGNGELGYGDGDEATCIPSGYTPICAPIGANKYMAYYFRKTINIGSILDKGEFIFNYKRDDGIVVYVNGTEVFRNNMPTGTITNTTAASTEITGAAENTIQSFTLYGGAPFVPGQNVISVEVHNWKTGITDTDVSFDMSLSHTRYISSSTADLDIPTTCNRVLFAGLYWTASYLNSGTATSWMRPGFDSVLFKLPGSPAYQTIVSQATDVYSAANVPGLTYNGYQCFADVTSLLNTTNANGTYSVANMMGPVGMANSCGGWTMVIAYSNPSLLPRNLTVFDGCAMVVSGSTAIDIGINGFLTPPTGPVSCELGCVVLDGDRGWTDAFQFRQQGASTFYNLANTAVPLNGANDAFNSKISYKGNLVTNRNPSYSNTIGFDASVFDLPNTGNAQLSNNQTAATIRMSSPSEGYIAQILTTSITQYNPAFALSKISTDINGGSLMAGDSLRYRINYRNVGNDASIQSVLIDNIPTGTTYKPGSVKINGVAKTDAPGDDEAEYDAVNNRIVYRLGTGATAAAGGNIAFNASGYAEFDVYTPRSCDILNCIGNTVSNVARLNYVGQISGNSLYDSSGVDVAGCITQGTVNNIIAGSCYSPKDTILSNICPATSALIPWTRYAGYRIYRAMPFTSANLYDVNLPVPTSGIYWAYFTNGAGCADTVRIRVAIMACPDIDDDNDGIPDYVELNNPVALQDHDNDGIPNWNDTTYPGFTDNNSDGIHDLFDPGADLDNDGIINFYDHDYPGYVDSNGDGVNDNMDKDLDGIPNYLDLDSDNDGIPDVVESGGADTDGDGRIDNYTDTDNDGLSQNVDGNNTGIAGSGNALGAVDLDGDGVPNYLDLDSDNDGIPDVIEALGTDADNDGKLDGFIDIDMDGLSDLADGDIGNDLVAEMPARALLRTGAPISSSNGRASAYPYKNFDNDGRANPYDLDSDGDGITDVREAGFTDANANGMIDGTIASDGWSAYVNGLSQLILPNTDATGNPDYLDIDSDGDGIPDNIEGQATAAYRFPTYTDTDNDGIDNAYDLAPYAGSFGGGGIPPYDRDLDLIPDYLDLDTDQDGQPDIIEGNDFNLNGQMDDLVTPLGTDADGDGLDDRFDLINSGQYYYKGTSSMMGTSGSITGDASPGSRTTVQRTLASGGCPFERDWRCVSYTLPLKYLQLTAVENNSRVALTWNVQSDQPIDSFDIERSTDNVHFENIADVIAAQDINQLKTYITYDYIHALQNRSIFYRVKVWSANDRVHYSNIVLVRKENTMPALTVHPNPATETASVRFTATQETIVSIRIIDAAGQVVWVQKARAAKGNNSIPIEGLSKLSNGVYLLRLEMDQDSQSVKLLIQK